MRSQDPALELVCNARSIIASFVVGCSIALMHLSTCTPMPQSAPSSRISSAASGSGSAVSVVTDAHLRPARSARPELSVDQAPGPVTALDGRTYAVVKITDWREECSGAGGEHYTFELDEPGNAPRVVHAGGHGIYLKLAGAGPLDRRELRLDTSGQVASGYFVAEVALRDPPYDSTHDAPGWCLSGLPAYAGSVLRLLPARDRDDARRQLAEIAVLGHPWAASSNLITMSGATPSLPPSVSPLTPLTRLWRHSSPRGGA